MRLQATEIIRTGLERQKQVSNLANARKVSNDAAIRGRDSFVLDSSDIWCIYISTHQTDENQFSPLARRMGRKDERPLRLAVSKCVDS
jgi:hypothetical protein